MKLTVKKKQALPATEVFQACPVCRKEEFIVVDRDLVCTSCDWNSCRFSVESGQMDNFMGSVRRLASTTQVYIRNTKTNPQNPINHEKHGVSPKPESHSKINETLISRTKNIRVQESASQRVRSSNQLNQLVEERMPPFCIYERQK